MKNLYDQQVAQVVKQAIKDNEAIAPIADKVHIEVKGGTITLDGIISNEAERKTVANTALAVGMVDKVNDHLEITPKK